MGRKARAVKPWSSKEAAQNELVRLWGAARFEEIKNRLAVAVLRTHGYEETIRMRKLVALLKRLGPIIREVEGLLEAGFTIFESARSDDVNRLALLHDQLAPLGHDPLGLKLEAVLQIERDLKQLVSSARSPLPFLTTHLRQAGPPAWGKLPADEASFRRRVLAEEAERMYPRLFTGTTLALLAIILRIDRPNAGADFESIRRAWEARLKAARRGKGSALQRLKGEMPEQDRQELQDQFLADLRTKTPEEFAARWGPKALETIEDRIVSALERHYGKPIRTSEDVEAAVAAYYGKKPNS